MCGVITLTRQRAAIRQMSLQQAAPVFLELNKTQANPELVMIGEQNGIEHLAVNLDDCFALIGSVRRYSQQNITGSLIRILLSE